MAAQLSLLLQTMLDYRQIYWDIANMFRMGTSVRKNFTYVASIVSCDVLVITIRQTSLIQSQADETITVDNISRLEIINDDIPGVFVGFVNNDGTKLISSTGTEILIWNIGSAQ